MTRGEWKVKTMTTTQCWICGGLANTREHQVKKSDLRDLLGKPTQQKPVYFHTEKRSNRRIGSFNNDILKSPTLICQYCNSTRTQPYDFAWQKFSEKVRSSYLSIKKESTVPCNRIFPYDTRREMLNVHLYFIKLFGCRIIEANNIPGKNLPIDIKPFSDAIMQERSHPNVYLAFESIAHLKAIIGPSNIQAELLDGQCSFAAWCHNVGSLSVLVMYAADNEKRDGLLHAWHPQYSSKRIMIKKSPANS